MLSTALLPGSTPSSPINVNTLGQSGTQSVVFAGATAGEKAGFSVADGGNVNGVASGGTKVDDLLIGSPAAGANAGAAYLIYGGGTLANLSTTVTTSAGTVRYINLANVGTTTSTAVPGAIFTGPASQRRDRLRRRHPPATSTATGSATS